MLINLFVLVVSAVMGVGTIMSAKWLLSARNWESVNQAAARQYRLLSQINGAYHAPYEMRPELIQKFKHDLALYFAELDAAKKGAQGASKNEVVMMGVKLVK